MQSDVPKYITHQVANKPCDFFRGKAHRICREIPICMIQVNVSPLHCEGSEYMRQLEAGIHNGLRTFLRNIGCTHLRDYVLHLKNTTITPATKSSFNRPVVSQSTGWSAPAQVESKAPDRLPHRIPNNGPILCDDIRRSGSREEIEIQDSTNHTIFYERYVRIRRGLEKYICS